MKKNNFYKLLSCFLLSTVILFISYAAYGSWASLSVDDLIKKSDSVLIGEVVKKIGEAKDGMMWQVKADYYLKGELRDQIITVTTPPNNVSTHYNLNEWGKRVLLFMRKNGDYYTPLSPQAVLSITFDNDIQKGSNILSGHDLASNIKINDSKTNEEYRMKLIDFITKSDVFQPVEMQSQNKYSGLMYLCIVAGMGILIAIFRVRKNRHK